MEMRREQDNKGSELADCWRFPLLPLIALATGAIIGGLTGPAIIKNVFLKKNQNPHSMNFEWGVFFLGGNFNQFFFFLLSFLLELEFLLPLLFLLLLELLFLLPFTLVALWL